ncbi:MAG: PEP-CTERM sorting domain-containing protein [Akkermansiaceae bacterium]|nr:PEP-CTERM sorting domain-containing protein [Akkermansiaceae bacterium]
MITKHRPIVQKTMLALAVAAGLASFAGSAKAAIVYSDIPMNSTNWAGKLWSIGGFTNIFNVGAYPGRLDDMSGMPGMGGGQPGSAYIYGGGDTDAKFVESDFDDVISMATTGLSSFNSLANGNYYRGFSFNNNGTTDYGWLALSVSGVGEYGDTSVNILSYAYDNTGSSIKVGQTAAVPEPSTYALFGIGVLALFARRRKVA